MEQQRIKYRIQKTSCAPMTAVIFTILAIGCLLATYWSVLYKYYFQHGTDALLYKETVVYSVLIGALALFALFTGSLGKRTLTLSAICTIPICLFYTIERCGLLTMLFSNEKTGFFEFYEKNTAFYSGNNLLIVCAISLFMLLVMFCFWAVVFNNGKSRAFAMFILFLSPFVRILYAYYDVSTFSWPLYYAKDMTLTVFAYYLLDHAAAIFFLFALMVIAASLKRTIREKDTDADGIPGGPSQPEPVYADHVEPPIESVRPAEPAHTESDAEPAAIALPEPEPQEAPAEPKKRPSRRKSARKQQEEPTEQAAPEKDAEESETV